MLLFWQACVILIFWTHTEIFTVNSAHTQDTLSSFTISTESSVADAASFNNLSSSLATKHFEGEEDSENSSQDSEDSEVVEDPIEFTSSSKSNRERRQLFLQPNFGYPTTYSEGTECITTRGFRGSCVNFRSCPYHPYQRYGRQLAFIALRQWHQPGPLVYETCTFYDHYGWPNSGVCCTNEFSNGFGNFGTVPQWPTLVQPVQPPFVVQPRPPGTPLPPPPGLPAADDDSQVVEGGEFENEDRFEVDNNKDNEDELDTTTIEDPNGTDSDIVDNSPEFQDVNNVVYDSLNESDTNPPAPAVYDDFQYQWPLSHESGVIQQWPPPLPTHPPSFAKWPPPIPTHPPGHHYPTHPPSSVVGSSTPAFPTQKSTRRTSTSRRPTTLRPNRPGYPSHPAYPIYPTYRPITTTSKPRPRPTTTAVTTSTTRRPSVPSDATSANGLPLKCGIKNPVSPDQERIVGGTNASPHEFPWIAVLFRRGRQFCGGSIITKDHILTAAHCVAKLTSWDVPTLTAHLGDYDIRSNFEVQHVERRIKRLVRHKGFTFSTLHNDVAILTLSEPIKFTYEIQPICLPTSAAQQARSYSGQVATVAGWGSLRENGPFPAILQKISVPIWSNSECARKYGRAAPAGIISSMLCAGQAARDSCSGDSGGPLVVIEGGRYIQVGIVSWGIGCGKGQYPGVYTRVTSLLPWIYKNIRQ